MRLIQKQILPIILLLIGYPLFSQENSAIKTLEEKRIFFEQRIIALEDSIQIISNRINKIKTEEIIKKIKDSSVIAFVRRGARLMDAPTSLGNLVTSLEYNDKVTIIEYYNNGYFKLCSNSICGFMNEMWIQTNSDLATLIDTKKKISQQNKIISKSLSSQGKSNTTSSRKKKYTTTSTRRTPTRTYIRGPRGGCYYINSNGNKTYVHRGLCN